MRQRLFSARDSRSLRKINRGERPGLNTRSKPDLGFMCVMQNIADNIDGIACCIVMVTMMVMISIIIDSISYLSIFFYSFFSLEITASVKTSRCSVHSRRKNHPFREEFGKRHPIFLPLVFSFFGLEM